MGKSDKKTPVVEETAGVKTEEVTATEAVVTEDITATEAVAPVVEEVVVETAEVHEAILIPSGIFIAKDGQQYQIAVDKFTFKGTVYTKEKALSDHADVLERLIELKSFILKKV